MVWEWLYAFFRSCHDFLPLIIMGFYLCLPLPAPTATYNSHVYRKSCFEHLASFTTCSWAPEEKEMCLTYFCIWLVPSSSVPNILNVFVLVNKWLWGKMIQQLFLKSCFHFFIVYHSHRSSERKTFLTLFWPNERILGRWHEDVVSFLFFFIFLWETVFFLVSQRITELWINVTLAPIS